MNEIPKKALIHEWPEDDRPREKLFKWGPRKLSDSELLAILLGTGTRGQNVLELSRHIMAQSPHFHNMHTADLAKIPGLGLAKIAQIKAALEIGRRFRTQSEKEPFKIRSSQEAYQIFLPHMRGLKIEIFQVILLNSQNRVIEVMDICEGTVNRASPFIREIYHKAIEYSAVSIVCGHNHPSGDPSPSPEDRKFTQELVQAGKILGIRLLDHLIVGEGRYYSFGDQGAIEI